MRVAWAVFLAGVLQVPLAYADDTASALFQTHCASCHGADRLGRIGPALLPENLGRLKREHASVVIQKGRAATQMPAFAGKLTAAQTQALVDSCLSGVGKKSMPRTLFTTSRER